MGHTGYRKSGRAAPEGPRYEMAPMPLYDDSDPDLWHGLEAMAVALDAAKARLCPWPAEDLENPERYVEILSALKSSEAQWRGRREGKHVMTAPMTLAELQRVVELCWVQGETRDRLVRAMDLLGEQALCARGPFRERMVARATVAYLLAQPKPAHLLRPSDAEDMPRDRYVGTGLFRLASGAWATATATYTPKGPSGYPQILQRSWDGSMWRAAPPEEPDAVFWALYPDLKPQPDRVDLADKFFGRGAPR